MRFPLREWRPRIGDAGRLCPANGPETGNQNPASFVGTCQTLCFGRPRNRVTLGFQALYCYPYDLSDSSDVEILRRSSFAESCVLADVGAYWFQVSLRARRNVRLDTILACWHSTSGEYTLLGRVLLPISDVIDTTDEEIRLVPCDSGAIDDCTKAVRLVVIQGDAESIWTGCRRAGSCNTEIQACGCMLRRN